MTTGKIGQLDRRRSVLKKVLATSVLAAVLTIPALTPPASAQAAPQGTIEAFIGSNLVNVQGYPAGKEVTIQVIRNDIVVGSVTGTTDGTGFLEINHGGGGPPPAGDCFTSEATPDIVAGDAIRTAYLTDPDGPEGPLPEETVVQSEVVRDISVNFDTISTNVQNGTITISGHARSLANAPINAGDVLELRLNKGSTDRWDSNGRKDLRVDIGADLRPNGTFTRVLNVSQQDARDWQNSPGEVSLEWSAAAGAGEEEEVSPPAIFVADEAGGEAILGCPPLSEYGIKSSTPQVVNKAFVDGDAKLVLGGVSFDASNVRVTLNDRSAATAPVVLNVQPAAADGAQTWTTAFTNAQVEALQDGMLTATAVYTISGQDVAGATITRDFRGENLRILKDVVAPARAPIATPKAGVYDRAISVTLKAQVGTKIHYTVNGSRPTEHSRMYTRPIRVTGTQTIKAVAVDRAGNTSPIGSYLYRIR